MLKGRVGSILDVRILFDEDPARPWHLLKLEAINKLGTLCPQDPFLHLSESIFVSQQFADLHINHILSHNLETLEHITTIAALLLGTMPVVSPS